MLFCSALFLKGISCLFEGITASEVKVELPDTFLSWIFCLLNFLCAGFYEEVLYRMYFPEAFYTLAGCKIKWKYLKIFCEAAACLAFAFAHLYLGFFAVINAALAHVILRWCLKFSGNLWSGVAAHFVYNVISLILL